MREDKLLLVLPILLTSYKTIDMGLDKYPKYWYILYLDGKPTKQRLYITEYEAEVLNNRLKKGKWVKMQGE